MDKFNLLSPAVVASLVSLIFFYLLKIAIGSRARAEDGMKWLEYGAIMKFFPFLQMAIVIGLLFVLFDVEEDQIIAVIFLIAFFTISSIALAIEVFKVKIGFNDKEIKCKSGWRNDRTIPWDKVKRVHYNQGMKWWVIKTEGKGDIKLHSYLSGLNDIFIELESRNIPNA
jgi:hypothetical protein